jgi:hypothetical protein
MIARKPAALRNLHALLREGAVQKSYLALVVGRWELGRKLIDAPLHTDARLKGERTVRVGEGGRSARTQFKLVQQYGAHASLVEATLETGRTHQIRVHAAYCGHPVAGDVKYGNAPANAALREAGLHRMFLHAHSLSLDWPQGGALSLSSPLPAELKAVLDQLSREPDQRQPHQCGGIVRVDALAQTDAQRFAPQRARAIVGLVGGEVRLDFLLAQVPKHHGGQIDKSVGVAALLVDQRHGTEELHGAARLRAQLRARGLGPAGFVEYRALARRHLIGADHQLSRMRLRHGPRLGERQPFGPRPRHFAGS